MASPPIIPNVTAVQPHAIPFNYDHDEKSGLLHYNPNLAPKVVAVDMPDDSDRDYQQTYENPPNSSSPGGGAKKTRRSSKKRASHKRLRKDKRKGTRKAKRGAKRTRRR